LLMTLLELSEQYAHSAHLLRMRIRTLRQMERTAEDEETRKRLHRRIADLQPMLTQCRQLQLLTAHYYERSFHRNERYTL